MGLLAGVKVLEFEAIGPAPFCGMMLADMGADVLLVDRLANPTRPRAGALVRPPAARQAFDHARPRRRTVLSLRTNWRARRTSCWKDSGPA
jgi:crotonobetainyl-CoA:carnitine CoA-transferase CaiB-like acyl-CoA transferase